MATTLADLTGELDAETLAAIYREHADYDLPGVESITRAAIFIKAGRMLETLVESDKNGERLRFDPAIEAARIEQAVGWLHVKRQTQQVGTDRFADFGTNDFRHN